MPAGATLVPATTLVHEPRIAAAPRAERFSGRNGRPENLDVVSPQLGRQVVELDLIRLGQSDCQLDETFELAHVARPGIQPQGVDSCVRQRQVTHVVVTSEKVDGEL